MKKSHSTLSKNEPENIKNIIINLRQLHIFVKGLQNSKTDF